MVKRCRTGAPPWPPADRCPPTVRAFLRRAQRRLDRCRRRVEFGPGPAAAAVAGGAGRAGAGGSLSPGALRGSWI